MKLKKPGTTVERPLHPEAYPDVIVTLKYPDYATGKVIHEEFVALQKKPEETFQRAPRILGQALESISGIEIEGEQVRELRIEKDARNHVKREQLDLLTPIVERLVIMVCELCALLPETEKNS